MICSHDFGDGAAVANTASSTAAFFRCLPPHWRLVARLSGLSGAPVHSFAGRFLRHAALREVTK